MATEKLMDKELIGNPSVALDRDILEARWRQVRGRVRQRWGEIADSDLDKIQGRYEQLVGLVQEKYYLSRSQAEAEVNELLEQYRGGVRNGIHELEDLSEAIQEQAGEVPGMATEAVSSSPWRAIVATALISLVAGLVLSRILSQR